MWAELVSKKAGESSSVEKNLSFSKELLLDKGRQKIRLNPILLKSNENLRNDIFLRRNPPLK